MAKLGIITGVSPNDNLGDTLLEGAIKINSNFNEIYNYFGNSNDLTSGVLNKTSVGVNTLSNIGIGTTNPTSKLTVSGNGLFSGVVTATSFSGNATYAFSAGIATYASSAGIATYATTAGITTYATTAGIATYSSSSGIATYATTAGIATIAVGLGSTSSINTSGIITASNFALSTGTGYIGFSTYQTLTSGTSWTVPTGVRLIKVYATGGGGGGGYDVSLGRYIIGGSAATAIRYYKVTPGTSASYTIGAAGIGTNNGYGSSGGNTTFTYSGVTITGVGGTSDPSSYNLPPPIATGGQVNLYGGTGSISNWSTQPISPPQITSYGLGGPGAGGNGGNGGIVLEY